MGKGDEEKKDIVAEQNELAEEIKVAEDIKLRLKCHTDMLKLCYENALGICQEMIDLPGGPGKFPGQVVADMAFTLFESVIHPEKEHDKVKQHTAPPSYLKGVGHALMNYVGHGITKPGVCQHRALHALSKFHKYFADHPGEVYPMVAVELLREFALVGYECLLRCPECLMLFNIEKIKRGDIFYE